MSKRQMAEVPEKHRPGRIRDARRGLGNGASRAEDHELMRSAGGVWEPGARQGLIERRRIGPVIGELECTVDPLFRQAGIRLDLQGQGGALCRELG